MSAWRKTSAVAVSVCAVVAWAAASVSTQSATAQFEISGTSTVRGWMCPAEGTLEVTPGGSGAPVPGFPDGVETAALTVRVTAIQCPEEQMTEHMLEAMHAEEYPEIVFRLEEYTFRTDDTVEAAGTMTIHGTTNPITFDIQLVQTADGMRGVGEAELDMTAYGIDPPSVWLGMLNVGEVVTIKFEAPLPASE